MTVVRTPQTKPDIKRKRLSFIKSLNVDPATGEIVEEEREVVDNA